MIYLAEIELRKTPYMGNEKRQKVLRLVSAVDEVEARKKVETEYEKCEQGGDSCFVWNLELSEMIE